MKKRQAGQALGPFTLVRKIATGGAAEIWAAQGHGGSAALKILHSELWADPSFSTAYREALNTVVSLDHPSIARVDALHEADGDAFTSGELIDGLDLRRTLSRLARRGERLPVPLALHVGREVCSALRYAAARGVTHGGISPHDVMLVRNEGVKVLDFGIAQALRGVIRRQPDRARGKASYLAPEQARGAIPSERSDVFSLGVVLWEILAMRRLFAAAGDEEALALVAAARVDPVAALNASVPAEADDLIQRMLSVEPSDRPTSVVEVGDALDRILRERYPRPEAHGRKLASRVQTLLGASPSPSHVSVGSADLEAEALDGSPAADLDRRVDRAGTIAGTMADMVGASRGPPKRARPPLPSRTLDVAASQILSAAQIETMSGSDVALGSLGGFSPEPRRHESPVTEGRVARRSPRSAIDILLPAVTGLLVVVLLVLLYFVVRS